MVTTPGIERTSTLFLSLVHPDAEWRADGAEDLFIGVKTVYHGHAGVREGEPE